jgi:hypothetical protein
MDVISFKCEDTSRTQNLVTKDLEHRKEFIPFR